MDPKKVAAVEDWPQPKKTRDIQVFLGFTNFYRRFIRQYARITRPLTALLAKGAVFDWNTEAQQAFQELKSAFKNDIILAHPDETAPFIVETDASDYAIGGVLSQSLEGNEQRPVAFYSRQMNPSERNYHIYDKELLAIISCLKQWRHFLQGSGSQFVVITDHKNLEYFMTTKRLTRRQARWSEFLAEFDFKIVYRPGAHNNQADSLSRRPDFQVDAAEENITQVLHPAMLAAPVEADKGSTLRHSSVTSLQPRTGRSLSPTFY